ncbi:MAG TPA: ABC transporter ATP-binding protein [Conexibacter sp.]|nr:ABC transporter ATP-binding protein [Conexibacter sp.]
MSDGAPLLELEDVAVTFRQRATGAPLKPWSRVPVHAVAGVSLQVGRGEMVALVGESGSGKTSTGHLALRLIEPSAGTIRFDGRDVTKARGRQLRELRRRMQLIFQDPYEALDPRCRVGAILEEPLQIHEPKLRRAARRERAAEGLARVGLSPPATYLRRYPHELSGGQRQRAAIAASLMLGPELVVADEPVSMLDVSVRAEIMGVLGSLRDAGMGVLLITHDLPTAAKYADRIAVMYLGRIIEIGPAADVVDAPQHPYTRALLSVVPRLDPRLRKQLELLAGEVPNPTDVPSGCRFHPRCPVAFEDCPRLDPRLAPVPDDPSGRHTAACLLVNAAAGEPAAATA